MKSIQKLHFVAYLIMTVMTLILAVASVVAAVSGNVDIIAGGLAAVIFVIFAVIQIGCLAVYKPGFTPYKVGFYLMHVGLLVLLAGLAGYELAGSDMTVQVPVSPTGGSYKSVRNENGEEVDLGFAFKIDQFTIEKYESGNDKYYRADVSFTDPTTLKVDTDYLEVNRTLRRNGWKLYLMDYSDGLKNLAAQGLTADSFYETYSAEGETSGQDLLSLIYQDVAGKQYSYYLYDDANGFTALTREQVAVTTGSLWAYTFEANGAVSVYLTAKDGAFAETKTSESGTALLSHIEATYPEKRVNYYYYTIEMGKITAIDAEYISTQCTDEIFAGIRDNGENGISVYVMKEEMLPANTFSSTEGGSTLLAEITNTHGEESDGIIYMLYSPQAGGYTRTEETAIAELDGELRGYAMNMGGQALVYVHPLSLILLIKHDPGEYATIIGMVSIMLGAVLMCLVKGRKKNAPEEAPEEASEEAPAEKAAAPSAKASNTKKSGKSKGGKK